MTESTTSVAACISVLATLLVAIACFPSDPSENQLNMQEKPPPAIPLHGVEKYTVKYLGITCGHMSLESSLESHEGRPAYHIIMKARNSKFFNKIYRVETQIESWIDAESLSSIAYLSRSMEKGEESHKEYRIDRENKKVTANKDGEITTFEFESDQPVLDPMAYVYRLRRLADTPGESVTLTLLTSKGAVDTIAEVSALGQKSTVNGKKLLVQVKPRTADGEMFARKGEFSLWVDPEDNGALYKLDFDLSFGHLIAKLRSSAHSEASTR